jgi:hypothetical protein
VCIAHSQLHSSAHIHRRRYCRYSLHHTRSLVQERLQLSGMRFPDMHYTHRSGMCHRFRILRHRKVNSSPDGHIRSCSFRCKARSDLCRQGGTRSTHSRLSSCLVPILPGSWYRSHQRHKCLFRPWLHLIRHERRS